MKRLTQRHVLTGTVAAASVLVLAGCSGQTPTADPSGDGDAASAVTLTVSLTQNEQTPNYYCGVALLKERLEGSDLGFTVDLFPSSQLGPHADRFPMVQSGDIDVDLLGGSELAASFPAIEAVDAAYAFNDVDHAFSWMDSGAEDLFTAFHEATGVRIVDGWFFGNRTFTTKDVEIRSPKDLEGVPLRFPNSPGFLANAKALGVTNPVSVAVEEVYTALQQGIAVGQENPIVATHSSSYDEVLNVAVLNNHNVGIQFAVVGDRTYEKLSEEQADLLDQTLTDIRGENRECVEKETDEIVQGYRDDANFTVIEHEDIDIDAFTAKAEEFFLQHYSGDTLEAYKSIRATAE